MGDIYSAIMVSRLMKKKARKYSVDFKQEAVRRDGPG